MKRLDIYGRLIAYLRPYWRQVALAYTSTFFATLLNLTVPLIIAWAIDQGLASGDAKALFAAAGLILIIALVRALVGFGQRFFGEWLTYRTAYDLRNEFYNSVQNLPFAFHDKAHTGDLMSRATGDISETERFVGIGLMELVATILLLVGVMVAMLLLDARAGAAGADPISILDHRRHPLRLGGATDVAQRAGSVGRALHHDAGKPDRHPGGESFCPRAL